MAISTSPAATSAALPLDELAYGGSWLVGGERILAGRDARLRLLADDLLQLRTALDAQLSAEEAGEE